MKNKALYLSFLLVLIFSFKLKAQENPSTNSDSNEIIEEDQESFDSERIHTIQLIKENLTNLKHELNLKEKTYQETKDRAEKLIQEPDLNNLRKRYNKAKLNLITVITNIKIDNDDKNKDDKKRDLIQEAQQLVGPALDSIQRISAKPRKIEKIRNRVAFHEEQIVLLNQALKNLTMVKDSADFKLILPDIAPYINDSMDEITEKKQEHILKINLLNSRLNDMTKDKKKVWDVVKEGVHEFLTTRGKNLALSLLVFFLSFWPMLKFREKVISRLLAIHPNEWYVKPINAFYGVISFVVSFGLCLFTLSSLGDWVLVTLTIIGITGLLWASKDYLPKYLTEFKLILNFGTIKEGELVVYEGLPWKVKTIGFQTIFENEFLDSKQIRIQIAEIVRMHSRKILPNEQWFPSKTLDWVLLNDGVYGQVVSQTLEQVVIELLGSSRKYYRTQDYLGLFPTNMSHGFVIEQVWSTDYKNQAQIFSTFIPKLEAGLKKKLEKNQLLPIDLNIQFFEAAQSSLNVLVSVKFDGSYARDRQKIIREINSCLLQLSTEESWNIPFNQIVVHQVQA
jgi:hypothetical protein